MFLKTSDRPSNSHDPTRTEWALHCRQGPGVQCHASRESSRVCRGYVLLGASGQGKIVRVGGHCSASESGLDLEQRVRDAKSIQSACAMRWERGCVSSLLGLLAGDGF